jgi:hypothetical protein
MPRLGLKPTIPVFEQPRPTLDRTAIVISPAVCITFKVTIKESVNIILEDMRHPSRTQTISNKTFPLSRKRKFPLVVSKLLEKVLPHRSIS